MDYDFDVAVIGSGAGGGTVAYALARAGKSVLVLERGASLNGNSSLNEKQTMVDMLPYDERFITFKRKKRRFYNGGLVGAVFSENVGSRDTFVKQLGFTDLYYGTEKFPHKLGYAQSVPTLGPRTFAHKSHLPIPPLFSNIFLQRLLLFMGTVEDLPLTSNRIELGRGGDIQLYHQFHQYDLFRSKYYLRTLRRIMRGAGATAVFGFTSDKNVGHTAHQVGTVRFGSDPKTSVIDPMCRLFYHKTQKMVRMRLYRPGAINGPLAWAPVNRLNEKGYKVRAKRVESAPSAEKVAFSIANWIKNEKSWVGTYDEPVSFRFLKILHALSPRLYYKLQMLAWRKASKFVVS